MRPGAAFYPASTLDVPAIGDVQAAVRRRLPRSVLRRGLLSAQHAQVMAEWEHGGGFSVDAEVRIEAHERDGLEARWSVTSAAHYKNLRPARLCAGTAA